MFSSVRRVFSAGTFQSTFVWQFGTAFLCHVLIVGSFRYMRVYMAPLNIMHWVTIHSLWFVYKCLCDLPTMSCITSRFIHYICVNMYSTLTN